MKPWTLLLLTILITATSWAQVRSVTVKGTIVDKSTMQSLPFATLTIQRIKDSSSLATGYADSKGLFSITLNLPDSCAIRIKYLGYRTISQPIISSAAIIDLGNITLDRTGLDLSAVEIKSPVTVKKDTLEFNADYFTLQEHASLKQLLQKVPGLFINKDGTIRLQGETVKKILIDGKPFLGDGTFMISADVIDKIQLIDAKNDEGSFTGLPASQTEKVINLTIKDEKRNHFSGNVTAGIGSNNRFITEGMVNRFQKGSQFSLFSKGNNMNDLQRNAGSSDGIERKWNNGINYNRDLGKTINLQVHYTFDDIKQLNARDLRRQNLLPDTSWLYLVSDHSENKKALHAANIRMEISPDSTQFISIMGNFNYSLENSRTTSDYRSQTLNGKEINDGSLFNTASSRSPEFYTAIDYRKKLKKPGRTFSTGFSYVGDAFSQGSYNLSLTAYPNPAGEPERDSINQHPLLNRKHHMFQHSLAYTEPLTKSMALRFAGIYTHDNWTADKATYDYDFLKKIYIIPNDSLSNSFKTTSDNLFAAATLHAQYEKLSFAIGINMLATWFDNSNLNKNTSVYLSPLNLFPTLMLTYEPARNKTLRFNYTTGITMPTSEQLQPVVDNTNPLFIFKGNPDLNPTRTDRVTFSYNDFNPSTMDNFNWTVNGSLVSGKIVAATYTDSLGKQVSEPANLNGAWNIGTVLEKSISIEGKASIKSSTGINFARDVNIINGTQGFQHNLVAGQTLDLQYTAKDHVDLGVAASVQYNSSSNSVTESARFRTWTYNFSINSSFNLPLGLILQDDLSYNIITGRAAGYNQQIFILNAALSKTLLKRKQGLLKIQGFDLLNNNTSLTRTIGQGFIEDVRALTLKRIFMVSFTYYLN